MSLDQTPDPGIRRANSRGLTPGAGFLFVTSGNAVCGPGGGRVYAEAPRGAAPGGVAARCRRHRLATIASDHNGLTHALSLRLGHRNAGKRRQLTLTFGFPAHVVDKEFWGILGGYGHA